MNNHRKVFEYMRVIAGSARRLPLKTPDGIDTRPTTDRIKETLFNILQDDIYGCRFLDLFSGSGGIGIEALSRGAAKAFFAENDRRAADCIRENLRKTRLEAKGVLLFCEAAGALRQLAASEAAMDIIFMDPPYNKQLENQMLEVLRNSPLADSHTVIIIEADLHTDFSFAVDLGYKITREKLYKTNKHIFLQKMENDKA